MKWGKLSEATEGEKVYSIVFRRYLEDCNEKAMLLTDKFSSALVGVAHEFNKSLAIYDSVKVISCLMVNENMTEDEARDYFEYNIKGNYSGEGTPLFLDSVNDILL